MKHRSPPLPVSVTEVIATVTFETGGTVDATMGRRGSRWLMWQRAAIVWCAHVKAGHQMPAIADALGQNRRSALNALQRAWMLRLFDAEFHRLTNLVAQLLACSAAEQRLQSGEQQCVVS